MKKRGRFTLWVIRDEDGKLYCTNVKPYRNYRSECKDDYEWFTDGEFMEFDSYNFKDLKFTDDPVEADIVKREYKLAEQ